MPDEETTQRAEDARRDEERSARHGDVVTAMAAHRLDDTNEPHVDRHLAGQWIGLFLAPTVFFAHLQVTYLLVSWACATGTTLWLHVAGVIGVLLAAAGTAVAWVTWQRIGRHAPGEAGGPGPRARLLAVTGLGTSAMFVLLLLGQWVPVFFLSPCQ